MAMNYDGSGMRPVRAERTGDEWQVMDEAMDDQSEPYYISPTRGFRGQRRPSRGFGRSMNFRGTRGSYRGGVGYYNNVSPRGTYFARGRRSTYRPPRSPRGRLSARSLFDRGTGRRPYYYHGDAHVRRHQETESSSRPGPSNVSHRRERLDDGRDYHRRIRRDERRSSPYPRVRDRRRSRESGGRRSSRDERHERRDYRDRHASSRRRRRSRDSRSSSRGRNEADRRRRRRSRDAHDSRSASRDENADGAPPCDPGTWRPLTAGGLSGDCVTPISHDASPVPPDGACDDGQEELHVTDAIIGDDDDDHQIVAGGGDQEIVGPADQENVRMVQCPNCELAFHQEHDYLTHVREEHIGDRAYECCACAQGFELLAQALEHFRIVHAPPVEEVFPDDPDSEEPSYFVCQCDFCGEFKSGDRMKIAMHILMLHGEELGNPYKRCASCQASYHTHTAAIQCHADHALAPVSSR